MDKIRTVVAISDFVMRGSLLYQLRKSDDFAVVGVSKTEADTLVLAQQHRPQLLITNFAPKAFDDNYFLTRVVAQWPKPRVMLISPFYTDWVSQQMYEKNMVVARVTPFLPETLIEDCRRLCATKRYFLEDPTSLLAQRVAAILDELSMPPRFKGYQYLMEAISMSVQDDSLSGTVTKVIYPTVARGFGSTASCVERAIRTAIKKTWQCGNQRAVKKYFGGALPDGGRPTNSAFIFTIAEYLREAYFADVARYQTFHLEQA